MLSGDEIATELNRLDVAFLLGGETDPEHAAVDPVLLLVSMASSDEARVQLAIIPLMLRRPELSAHVAQAVSQLQGSDLGYLVCYYTAAVLLQMKYESHLDELDIISYRLPDSFSTMLGLSESIDIDERLEELGRKQSEIVSRDVNWVGTYEHGATSFLRFHENRARWRVTSNSTDYALS